MQSVLGAQQNHAFATHYANTIRLANRAYGEILNPLAIFLSGLGNLRTGQFGNARIDFQRLAELRAKVDAALSERKFGHRRLLEAFPNLESHRNPESLRKLREAIDRIKHRETPDT